MKLAGDEPRMIGKLDDLDEPSRLERSRHHQPSLDECRPVVVVDLVAMTVPLVDDRLAVRLLRTGPLDQLDGLRPEAHRPAQILDLLLLRKQVDHGMRRLRVHLGRVRTVEAEDVTRVLRHDDVHTEAEAEIWDAALARHTAGEDLAFPAS